MGNLVSELYSLLRASGKAGLYDHTGPDGIGRVNYPTSPRIDAASVTDEVMWDRNRVGTGHGHPEATGYKTWEKWTAKFIATEILPEGDIIFHALKDTRVSLANWRSSKDIIENALERAFSNPRIHKYQDNFGYVSQGE